MANKPLKSIKFPGLNDTYTVPEVDATLATTGAAADAKKVGDEISDIKADLNQEVGDIKSAINYITPEMFGAKGDGIADDTVPFQRFINDSNRKKIISGKYRITSSITVNTITNLIGIGGGNRTIPTIIFEPVEDNKTLFVLTTGYLYIDSATITSNLTLDNVLGSGYKFCKSEISSENLDIVVKNCNITFFEIVFDLTGRGFVFENCQCNGFHSFLILSFTDVEDGESIIDGNFAFRRVIIRNNTFHAQIGQAGITNYIYKFTSPTNTPLTGLKIENNYYDGIYDGLCDFSCNIQEACVSYNTIIGQVGNHIIISGANAYYSNFVSNIIKFNEKTNSNGSIIKFSGTFERCIVDSNQIDVNIVYGRFLQAYAIRYCTVSNNRVRCDRESIRGDSVTANNIIYGNVLYVQTAPDVGEYFGNIIIQ